MVPSPSNLVHQFNFRIVATSYTIQFMCGHRSACTALNEAYPINFHNSESRKHSQCKEPLQN